MFSVGTVGESCICESTVCLFLQWFKEVSEKRDSFVVSGILSDDHNVSSTYDSESNAMFLLFSVHLFPGLWKDISNSPLWCTLYKLFKQYFISKNPMCWHSQQLYFTIYISFYITENMGGGLVITIQCRRMTQREDILATHRSDRKWHTQRPWR